jgi:quercetin dioxygenase-like cupin family protein
MFRKRIIALVLIATLLTFGIAEVLAHDAAVEPLMSQPLENGKEGLVLTVSYPPGGTTPIHRHDAHVFVYVLEGSITMQVTGGEIKTIGPGEMFYEAPEDVHAVSKNASDSESAKFLVFFVKDKDKPPVIPVN